RVLRPTGLRGILTGASRCSLTFATLSRARVVIVRDSLAVGWQTRAARREENGGQSQDRSIYPHRSVPSSRAIPWRAQPAKATELAITGPAPSTRGRVLPLLDHVRYATRLKLWRAQMESIPKPRLVGWRLDIPWSPGSRWM